METDIQKLAVNALEDLKGVDIRVLDVRGKTTITDYMIIVSGNSARHVRSLAENVIIEAKRADNPPLGAEGLSTGEWALVDLGDAVVHVMLPRTRDFYNLERLWLTEDQPDEAGQV